MPSLSLPYFKKTSCFAAQLRTNIHPPSAITSKRTLSAEIGEVRTSLHPCTSIGLIGNTVFDRFIDQHYEGGTVAIARLEMHSMNWLNVAAFNSVDIDFDVGRKFL